MSLAIALHRVSEKPDFLDSGLGNVISMNSLKELIDYFGRHSFVGLNDFLEMPKHSKDLVSLTFDDGNSSVHNLAYPFLIGRGIPFSVFVNSSNIFSGEPHWFEILEAGIRLSNRRSLIYNRKELPLETPLNKLESLARIKVFLKRGVIKEEELRTILNSLGVDYGCAIEFFRKRDMVMTPEIIKKLSDCGVEVGSHGMVHQILTRIPESEQEMGILKSKREVEEITQKECRYFSYPNGWTTDYNRATMDFLKRAGYMGAFTARVSFLDSEVKLDSDIYEMPRWCPSEGSLRAVISL